MNFKTKLIICSLVLTIDLVIDPGVSVCDWYLSSNIEMYGYCDIVVACLRIGVVCTSENILC